MAVRTGKTVRLEKRICIRDSAACVGQKEGQGPMGRAFDRVFTSEELNRESWEQEESELLKRTILMALQKAKLSAEEVDAVFSGDLLNQCTSSSFCLRELKIPFCGVYGACSTLSLGMLSAGLAIESGAMNRCIAAASSHFCAAEKQFRLPVEYAGQRSPTAQWTATAAGAAVLEESIADLPVLRALHIGTVTDYGIKDASNMGAAMAPAARKTICEFLKDTGTVPSDYDCIVTGDLGKVGSELFLELAQKEDGFDLSAVHRDCGLMMYDFEKQDVHAGGSGCGCSASLICSYFMEELKQRRLRKVLYAATGALLSPVTTLQGESIPGICHAVLLEMDEGEIK